MEIQRIRALRGPNRWSSRTSIEALVQCAADERDIRALDGFEGRLREAFLDLGSLPSGRGGQVSMAHALEAAALALQEQAVR
jgi:cyanophycin synthetase